MKGLLVSLLFVPMLALASEPPAKEAMCRACHGEGGAKPLMEMYPKLNGQNKAYLVSSMKAYKASQRQGGMSMVMNAQAASLSDADIEALASYYAAQP